MALQDMKRYTYRDHRNVDHIWGLLSSMEEECKFEPVPVNNRVELNTNYKTLPSYATEYGHMVVNGHKIIVFRNKGVFRALGILFDDGCIQGTISDGLIECEGNPMDFLDKVPQKYHKHDETIFHFSPFRF